MRTGIKEKKTEDGQGAADWVKGEKQFPTPDLSIHPSSHVPSLWRAVLIADFKTA